MFSISYFENQRRTRIIATLGPATNDRESVIRLLESGVNIIRLNMSHGSHDDHQHSFELVRQAARQLKQQVAIFCDLCGPKIRVGLLKEGAMQLRARSEVVVTTRAEVSDISNAALIGTDASAFQPEIPMFGICTDDNTARILMLHWGVTPVVMQTHETSNWKHMAKTLSRKLNIKLKGQSVAVLSGFGKRSDNNQPVLKLMKF